MLIARVLVLLLLLAAAGFFAFYIATGRVRYRRIGLVIVKWTVIAGLAFFAVLFIQRLV